MAKRSLGDLNLHQRVILAHWANHMGVSEPHLVNWLNSMSNTPLQNPWGNLDEAAEAIAQCGCADC